MIEKIPMVSVVMPAYNAEKYIEAAIGSVQKQTMEDWELIVVDDCSKDSTREIISRLAEKDERIKPVFSDVNQGAARSRNAALDRSRGRYIALLDADDVWYPDKLQRQVDHIKEMGSDIVYCSYAMVDGTGAKCHDDFIVSEATSLSRLLVKNEISCSTAMFTGEIAEKYRFTPEYYHEDFALWLQLLKDGKKATGIQDVLADYRLLPGSRASGKIQNAVKRWKIYREYMGYSHFHSAVLIAKYAYYGLKKYDGQLKT